jgi:hypothetical protein
MTRLLSTILAAAAFARAVCAFAADPTAALQTLREVRGKAGVVRNLLTPITVTPGAPGLVDTAEESTYVAIHLHSLVLRGGARVSLRNDKDQEVWQRTGDVVTEDLWLPPVMGESATLRCDVGGGSKRDCHAVIDRFARGLEPSAIPDANKSEMTKQAVCGTCELEDTSCPLPHALQSGKSAVARLLLAGTDTCTGFLVGDEGHLLTNVHCIGSEAEARNVVFEFNAEEASCREVDCTRIRKAPATRFERGAIWVGSDPSIDVAIVKLPASYPAMFGALKLRSSSATLHEALGIVQHPRGESRKFSIDNIRSTNGSPCGIGLAVTLAYNADTLPGSSGSPVISLQTGADNAVIAIHECFGCPNRGVPSQLIFQRLGHLLPASAFTP